MAPQRDLPCHRQRHAIDCQQPRYGARAQGRIHGILRGGKAEAHSLRDRAGAPPAEDLRGQAELKRRWVIDAVVVQALLERLDKIESTLALLASKQAAKDWYSTDEFAKL